MLAVNTGSSNFLKHINNEGRPFPMHISGITHIYYHR